MTVTDTIAIGAMNYLRESGVDIPYDVAIASFSGKKLSTIVCPALTTVEQPLHEMGARAAELIMQHLKGKNTIDQTIVMDAVLKYRASPIVI